jgi:hypothetical protein
VPWAELACCRVGDDGDVTAAQPSRAVLRPQSGPAARVGYQLVCLHGAGNRPPTRRGEGVCVSGSCRVAWPCLSQRRRLVVRGGDLSCEAETARRGSLGNWSERLPNGQ